MKFPYLCVVNLILLNAQLLQLLFPTDKISVIRLLNEVLNLKLYMSVNYCVKCCYFFAILSVYT
jgi:hypothetical protein